MDQWVSMRPNTLMTSRPHAITEGVYEYSNTFIAQQQEAAQLGRGLRKNETLLNTSYVVIKALERIFGPDVKGSF